MISLVEFIKIQEGLFSSKPKANYKRHGFSNNKNTDSFLYCIFEKLNPAAEEVFNKLVTWIEGDKNGGGRGSASFISNDTDKYPGKYDVFYVPGMSAVKKRFVETNFVDCHEEKNLSKLYKTTDNSYKWSDAKFVTVKSIDRNKYGNGLVYINQSGTPIVLILENIKAIRKAKGIK